MLTEIFSHTTNLFFPPCCLVCRRPLRAAKVCHVCYPRPVPFTTTTHCECCATLLSSPWDQAQSDNRCALCRIITLGNQRQRFLWFYRDNAQDLITALKYRPSWQLARWAADMSVRAFPDLFPELRAGGSAWDSIIALPGNPNSLMLRGFEPSVIIARALAVKYQVRFRSRTLRFTKAPKIQASLAHDRRIANVRGRITVRRPFSIPVPARVLLVDDVTTTGATIAAASAALFHAGCTTIDTFTLARSEHWQEFRWIVSKTAW